MEPLINVWSLSSTYGASHQLMEPLINLWSLSSTYGASHQRMEHLVNLWSQSSTYGASHQLMELLINSWSLSSTYGASHRLMEPLMTLRSRGSISWSFEAVFPNRYTVYIAFKRSHGLKDCYDQINGEELQWPYDWISVTMELRTTRVTWSVRFKVGDQWVWAVWLGPVVDWNGLFVILISSSLEWSWCKVFKNE